MAHNLISILTKFFVQGLHYAITAVEHSDFELRISHALACTSTIQVKYIIVRRIEK